jgi:SOS-response transcriptional repressor LexA
MNVKKLGLIQAGFASPVDEELADVLRIEDYLIRDKNASFLLRMDGDSMTEYGICDGDMLIFERGADVRPGDLAVFMTEGGHRVYFLDKKSAETLWSERSADRSGIQILGPVVSIVRKYK